jgi:hypothetical protein
MIGKPLSSVELNRIIERWDDGGGVTAAVQAFAQAMPVTERTVWYWLGGRTIHAAFVERIRSLKPPKTRKINRKKER